MNYLRIDGLIIHGQEGQVKQPVKLLDFENNRAVLIDNTHVSPFWLFTPLNDFDERICFYRPNTSSNEGQPAQAETCE